VVKKCGTLPVFPSDVKMRRGFAASCQFPGSSFQLRASGDDELSDRDLRGQRCTSRPPRPRTWRVEMMPGLRGESPAGRDFLHHCCVNIR